LASDAVPTRASTRQKLARMNTPDKHAGPATQPRFNYLVLLDIVVLACILVVAGRPDGLAITVSAVIVAVCAVIYRCSVGIRTTLSAKARPAAPAPQEVDRKFTPTTYREPEQTTLAGAPKSTSWLRDAD
jgi:hypothetical protein